MQTFVTSFPENGSFADTALILDGVRLSKQVTEAAQIVDVLEGRIAAWQSHPAVLMWQGFADGLKMYHNSLIRECQRRHFKAQEKYAMLNEFTLPSWCFEQEIIDCHRARLYFKGRCDSTCSALKKALKLKSLNLWLKENDYPDKNVLNIEDVEELEKIVRQHGGTFTANHYVQFKGSGERDSKAGYIWPTKTGNPINPIQF